jgi:hypothetical protein
MTKITDSDTVSLSLNTAAWYTYTLNSVVSVDSGTAYYISGQSKAVLGVDCFMRYSTGASAHVDSLLTESGHTFEDWPATNMIEHPLPNDVSIYALGYKAVPSSGQVIIIGGLPDTTSWASGLTCRDREDIPLIPWWDER